MLSLLFGGSWILLLLLKLFLEGLVLFLGGRLFNTNINMGGFLIWSLIQPFLYTNYRNLRHTRKIFLETMRIIIFLISAASSIYSQHYNVYVLGLHAADVVQEKVTAGLIKYTTQNRGIFDLIWPASNFYTTNYDTLDFRFINYEKKIEQNSDKNVISGKMNQKVILCMIKETQTEGT